MAEEPQLKEEPKQAKGRDMDKEAQMVVNDWTIGSADMDTLKSDWQEISEYCLPQSSQIDTKKTLGIDEFTAHIFDETAILAAQTLGGGMMDQMFGGKWFELEPPFEDASDSAKQWYKRTGEIMLKIINRSNFYMALLKFLKQKGTFGTSHFHVEEDDDDVISCKAENIGTYVIFNNSKGLVDKVIVKKEFTPSQLLQEYGEEGKGGNLLLDPKIREKATKNDKDQKDNLIEVLIWVGKRPEKDREDGKLGPLNMPIKTLHVMIGNEGGTKTGTVLRESGYEEMRTLISRWDEWGQGPWGYSPFITAMPLIRQLNGLEENQDLISELHTNPRVLAPDGIVDDIDFRANGITTYNGSDPKAKPEEWLSGGRVDIGQERIERKQSKIEALTFTPLFQLLTSAKERNREKTAFEVAKMLDEQVGLFHPMFTRHNVEFATPFLTLLFTICFRRGKFPDPPQDVIRQNNLKEEVIETPDVSFTSKIAMLIRARDNAGFLAFMEMAMIVTGEDLGAINRVVNSDRAIKTLAENGNVASAFLNTTEEQREIEAAQAEQAQQEQQLAQMESMAKSAKDMGGAPDSMQDAIGKDL